MASQMGAISNSSIKRNQVAELNARQALLPTIIANKNRAEDISRQASQFNKQLSHNQEVFDYQQDADKKAREAQKRAAQVGMGLEAAKLGTTLATQYSGKTFGDLGNSAQNLFSGSGGSPATSGMGMGNVVNKLSVGSMIGGGLAGYGVANMMGDNTKKWQKGLGGLGVGAALGLLGGGSDMFSGALSGGFGGAIGGLFG